MSTETKEQPINMDKGEFWNTYFYFSCVRV